jgi:hypothetical protein
MCAHRRTHLGTSDDAEMPETEMAVLTKDAMSLEWSSTPYGGRYRKYQGSGDDLSSQPYELYFRDSEVDGTASRFSATGPTGWRRI